MIETGIIKQAYSSPDWHLSVHVDTPPIVSESSNLAPSIINWDDTQSEVREIKRVVLEQVTVTKIYNGYSYSFNKPPNGNNKKFKEIDIDQATFLKGKYTRIPLYFLPN